MTVADVGRAEVAKLLLGTGTAFSNVAIGQGTESFTGTSTQLTNEYARDTATTSTDTTDTTGDTAVFIHTFNFTETVAITEAGVFNDDSAGEMLAAQVFAAINLGNNDSLQITYKIDVD